jgi:hypothetical protein
MSNNIYDVFISSSHKDRAWVAEFAESLKQEGLYPWSDSEIALGGNWTESIENALRNSETLVFVLSPDPFHSKWTYFELGAAIADNKRIIPVLTHDLEWSQVPPMLRKYQGLNESSPRLAGKRIAEVVGKRGKVELSQQSHALGENQ